MKIMRNESSESGYQPRPPAPPSAGRALSVLVAVCAVLWVWWMLPEWLTGTAEWKNQQWLWRVMYCSWSCLFLSATGSLCLFYWAIRPLWLSDIKGDDGANQLIVLWLCLSFQAVLLLIWLCIFLITLDNTV
jgi:hypothetical protein